MRPRCATGKSTPCSTTGSTRYFAGRYEEAIHLWTRVLFLDRNHARARAYIERARTALAEMQRRSDELLQASRDLLEQGETDAARQLLTRGRRDERRRRGRRGPSRATRTARAVAPNP